MHWCNDQQRTSRKQLVNARTNMRTVTTTNNERRVIIRRSLILVALSMLVFLATVRAGRSVGASPEPVVKNVVLVHGAFADGSSYSRVIPLLEAKGLHVTAVQNPLTSLADDVAATRRAIASQNGPVILVGHSWAGMVISEAGNDPKVAALVYIAALVPDDGQSSTDVVADPAWKTKPSWYIVVNDRMLPPEYEQAIAKHIHARTTILTTGHVPMLSMPNKVAAVIIDAANNAGQQH